MTADQTCRRGPRPSAYVPSIASGLVLTKVTFEPNPACLRDLIDYTTLGTGYVREVHERFEKMQDALMGGEQPPSEQVVAGDRAPAGRP
ncbi:hypothetical protein [Nonomuraea rosea]|uniref:hypothetical protein n=1 Tax=Nonomuraea rosea TaxID=638574 RepID=UPI0031E4E9C0